MSKSNALPAWREEGVGWKGNPPQIPDLTLHPLLKARETPERTRHDNGKKKRLPRIGEGKG
jgi:hypothetical protein